MRIIHDIDDPYTQVTGGGLGTYLPKTTESGPVKGFRVSISIHSQSTHHQDEDSIYIEGDAACVRRALLNALHVVEASGELYVRDGVLDKDWKDEDQKRKKRLAHSTGPYEPIRDQ